ncbi:MAG: DUF3341 domain-containing protein [Planctomycetota bacterium]|nr:DUF3341 domain-containing protein [Planctomycetota bacterium]
MAHHEAPRGGAHESGAGGPLWGVVAEFPNPGVLLHAAEKVRDAGFKRWDVYAPVPVHGMPEAMGLKHSKVTVIMGFMAAAGCTTALLMQWWMGEVDYPIVTAGKPLFAWEQATPIVFELSVLFSAFGAVFGMLILNLLPRWNHPLFSKQRFLRVSDDRFMIAIEASDPRFSEQSVRELLASLGGTHIDRVEEST